MVDGALKLSCRTRLISSAVLGIDSAAGVGLVGPHAVPLRRACVAKAPRCCSASATYHIARRYGQGAGAPTVLQSTSHLIECQ